MLLNRDVYETSSLYHIYLYTKPPDHQRQSCSFRQSTLSLLTWRAPVVTWSYCTYMLLVRRSV